MENRHEVVQDYFKLRLLLNRTNLVRDQKTEVELAIVKADNQNYRLIATLTGIKNPRNIELCKTITGRKWRPSEHSGLTFLENFSVSYLQNNWDFLSSTENLRKVTLGLISEIRKLGIPD